MNASMIRMNRISRRAFGLGAASLPVMRSSITHWASGVSYESAGVTTVEIVPESTRFDSHNAFSIRKESIDAIMRGELKVIKGVTHYFMSLETYTKLSLVLPRGTTRDETKVVQSLLKKAKIIDRTRIEYGDNMPLPWLQDIGFPATTKRGKKVFIVPGNISINSDRYRIHEKEREIAKLLFGSENVIVAPFAFDGGNTIFARLNNRTVALIGESVAHKEQGRHIKSAELKKIISGFLNNVPVYFLGKQHQSQDTHAFHIDQSILPLHDGECLVARCNFTGIETIAIKERVKIDFGKMCHFVEMIQYSLEKIEKSNPDKNVRLGIEKCEYLFQEVASAGIFKEFTIEKSHYFEKSLQM